MADYPALPLWTDAYLADAGHLTDSEHGIYLQLLLHAWRSSGCRLPNDDKWLARRFHRSVEEIQKTVRPLIEEFFKTDGNWLTQKRLSKEYMFVKKTSKKQSERAKSRWKLNKVSCRSDAGAMPEPCSPAYAPTPTPLVSKETNATALAKKTPEDLELPNHLDRKTDGKKGRRLAADWRPDEQDREYATGLGLKPEIIAEAFRDHWTAKVGKDATALDWNAKWRTWCRNDVKWASERMAKRSQSTGVVASALKELADIEGQVQ